ncbi:MAG: LamG domain-containing protein [Deltaproteobacteria bacterium]|nr:LamG domain-containing protein [Deltaproteobacteria bacterium]
MKRLITLSIGLAALTGCEPTQAVLYNEDYALAFAGEGCVVAEGPTASIADGFTLEAWIRVAEAPDRMGILRLGGSALLWMDDGRVGLGRTDQPDQTGWIAEAQLADGRPHHLAVSWSLSHQGAFYVDGLQIGAGDGWLAGESLGQVHLGCNGPGADPFVGVLDEVRVSDQPRFGGDFHPSKVPYSVDSATLALWHMDGGVGDFILDSADQFPGTAHGVAWTTGLTRDSEAPEGAP